MRQHQSATEQPKRNTAHLLMGTPLLLLIVYFGVPLPFMAYYDKFEGVSPSADAMAGVLCLPISWLYENSPAYEQYLDWFARVYLGV